MKSTAMSADTGLAGEAVIAPEAARVLYVLRAYPRFSETFIVNEILELERRGMAVEILAMRRPDDGYFHESVCRVRARARYIPEAPDKLHNAANERLRSLWRKAPRGARMYLTRLRRAGRVTMADLWSAAYLIRDARKCGATHVHAHFGTEAATVVMVARLLGGPRYSLTLHAYDIFRENVDKALLTDKINHASFVVTVSRFNQAYLRSEYPEHDESKVLVVYNGIDLERFAPVNASREPWLIFSVGRLIEKKGFGYLIEAVAKLREAGHPARCVIAGDGREQAALEAQMERLGCADAVELAGLWRQDRVRDMLGSAGCFTLGCVEAADGNQDALPTVLLESLASGCPTISTRLSGIPEIIESERSGLLVEPGDSAALARAIERIFTEPDLAGRLSVGGRARAEERFAVSRNVEQLMALYQGDGAKGEPQVREAREVREAMAARVARVSHEHSEADAGADAGVDVQVAAVHEVAQEVKT